MNFKEKESKLNFEPKPTKLCFDKKPSKLRHDRDRDKGETPSLPRTKQKEKLKKRMSMNFYQFRKEA